MYTKAMKKIDIYTDGSARGNPGPAGWASIIMDHVKGSVVELGGRFDMATNNRMELLAVHDTLAYIEQKKMYDTDITFFIDSSYVQKGVTLWMYGWERNEWKTKDGGDVLNQDLWQEIFFLVFRLKRQVKITFEKIAGHAGHFGNEQADRVATSFADKKPTLLYKGSLDTYAGYCEGFVPEKKKTPSSAKTPSASSKKTGKAYSYVSYVGGQIFTDADWKTCEARVKGKSHVRYQKVFSAEEEARVVHEFKGSK